MFLSTPMAPERLDRAAARSLLAQADETISCWIDQADGFRQWLVALDLPIAETGQAWLIDDCQLTPRKRTGSKVAYRMTSALSIQTPWDLEAVYLKALQQLCKPRTAKQARLMGGGAQGRARGRA